MNPGSGSSSSIVVCELSLPEVCPTHLELQDSEIHVWQRQRDSTAPELAQMTGLLAADELDRARRFRFEKDRNQFVVSRASLRMLLGAYVGVSPRDLRFQYTQYARPILLGLPATFHLEFNVSHSGAMILWAIARGRRIGVDVENSQRDFNTLEIADRFFSAAERETLRALPVEQRHDAFFRCWTRKESFIKALGEGLSHPLDRFDVTLAPGDPARLLATRPVQREAERWGMWDVKIPHGYAAALVAELK